MDQIKELLKYSMLGHTAEAYADMPVRGMQAAARALVMCVHAVQNTRLSAYCSRLLSEVHLLCTFG